MTHTRDLLVANVSSLSNAFTTDDHSQRAQTFVGLKLLEGRVYGYGTVAEGVLIPWPESGLQQSTNVTMYESDVVVYNYSCHWMAVETNTSSDFIVTPGVLLDGIGWSATFNDRDIETTEDITALEMAYDPSVVKSIDISPLLAVAFTGNSTLMDLGSTGTFILFTPKVAMYLSVLLCDPQHKIQRANVTLSGGKLSVHILPTLPLLGNFLEDAANHLFSSALLEILKEADPGRPFNSISMLLFTEKHETGLLLPSPLSVINSNMNRALKSAAKAYLGGYNSFGESTVPGYKPWNQTATVQYQQLTLVASRPFLITLLTLVVVTVIILAILLKVVDIGKIQLFDLQTLEKIYADEKRARED